ncbi:hypothetical protein O181_027444 [Austropuccinia psidii MF-1]|uniref:Uncharacterized protein n=1 Tax=Austropuccinia psidii MF-1 TaxID=1389203 RepID=A0A9Q3CP22_9BASI|nr:hypothetical protein [Austropuccinia psidii MF-1]
MSSSHNQNNPVADANAITAGLQPNADIKPYRTGDDGQLESRGDNTKVSFKAQVQGYAKKFAGKTFGKEHEVAAGEARLQGKD